MRKLLTLALVVAGAFLFAASASAQNFITITGTVVDPNGIPYGAGTMSAVLTPGAPGGWTLGGQPYSGRVGPITLNSSGSFTATFGSNAAIKPAGTQWHITVNSNPGGIPPPLGTGAQTFSITITLNSSQNISTQLDAAAPKLTNFAGGMGTVSCSIAGGIAFETATDTLGCVANFLWASTTGLKIIGTGSLNDPLPLFHFGEPDSSLDISLITYTNLPGRSAIVDVGPGKLVDTTNLPSFTVLGQDGPSAALAVNNATTNNAGTFVTEGAALTAVYSNVTTTLDVIGSFNSAYAIAGSNITGDDEGEFGSIISTRNESSISGASHTDFLTGVQAVEQIDDASTTVTNVIGYRSLIRTNLGTPTVTNAYGFRADSLFQAAGATLSLTNNYGFYAMDQTVSGATFTAAYYAADQGTGVTDFAYYSAGGPSFFLGTTGMMIPVLEVRSPDATVTPFQLSNATATSSSLEFFVKDDGSGQVFNFDEGGGAAGLLLNENSAAGLAENMVGLYGSAGVDAVAYRTVPVAFGSAIACGASTEGTTQAFNNSNTIVWGTTIAAGGTNHVLGYCDGTNWTVAAI